MLSCMATSLNTTCDITDPKSTVAARFTSLAVSTQLDGIPQSPKLMWPIEEPIEWPIESLSVYISQPPSPAPIRQLISLRNVEGRSHGRSSAEEASSSYFFIILLSPLIFPIMLHRFTFPCFAHTYYLSVFPLSHLH